MKVTYYTAVLFFTIVLVYSCKKSYNPPATEVNNKFLAIDGSLVSSADSPSVIILSRSVRLSDTTISPVPETNATVSVEEENGNTYNFFEGAPGNYQLPPLLLNPFVKYRLKITTASGEDYASDFVEVKQTPAIDSITWQQHNDVMIYLDTHDLLNSSRYYLWNFTETWQYTSPLDASLSQANGTVFYVDSTSQTHICWHTMHSTELLTGTSVALTNDVIHNAPIAVVPQNSEKIAYRYSILVKQYALAEDAYHYFSILKKNTENLGSIFDAQPAQPTGNIHSVKNPSEIVIGFFIASSVTQKRIFITKNEVSSWNYVYKGPECHNSLEIIYPDQSDVFAWKNQDPSYAPYYFYNSLNLFIAPKTCVDCRVYGGVNKKPAYW